VDSKAEYTA